MPFVNERTTDEQKHWIRHVIPHLKLARDGSSPTIGLWTIDRDRDAMLIRTGSIGGSYSGTTVKVDFSFLWNGSETRLVAYEVTRQQQSRKPILEWHVIKLDVPPPLADRIPELKQLLSEAFRAMGFRYSPHSVEDVLMIYRDDAPENT